MQSMTRLDPIRLKLLIPNSMDRRRNEDLARSGVFALCEREKQEKLHLM